MQGGGLSINGGTVSLNNCNVYNNEAGYVSVATLPCPHGMLAFDLIVDVLFFAQYVSAATLPCPKSQRPNGKRAHPCCFVQGGGLVIDGGTVEFDSCSIYGNTALDVSLLFPKSQRPHGKPLVAHLMSALFVRRV